MKNITVFSALVIACTLIVVSAKCQVDPGTETPLDLNDHFLTKAGVACHDCMFNTRFKLADNKKDFHDRGKVIPMISLDTLYQIARDTLLKKTSLCSDQHCITGVRITLGLEGDSVIYFFQPIFMSLPDINDNKFIVHDLDSTKFYRYKINGFDSLRGVPDSFAQYRTSIRVKRFSHGKRFREAKEVNGDISWKGDTKSIIYSFQELYGLSAIAFKSNNAAKTFDRAEIVSFHNGADIFRRWPSNPAQRWRAKHLVYVRAVSDSGKFTLIRARNEDHSAANFAHLCPPSCQKLDFKIDN